MSDSVQPHRRQPTRLPRPWDSPGKNTVVGCHFLLQCMKVKSESEVDQLCLSLHDPMDCSLPIYPWDFPGKSTGVGCHCLLHLLLAVAWCWADYFSESQVFHTLNGKIDTYLLRSLWKLNKMLLTNRPYSWQTLVSTFSRLLMSYSYVVSGCGFMVELFRVDLRGFFK